MLILPDGNIICCFLLQIFTELGWKKFVHSAPQAWIWICCRQTGNRVNSTETFEIQTESMRPTPHNGEKMLLWLFLILWTDFLHFSSPTWQSYMSVSWHLNSKSPVRCTLVRDTVLRNLIASCGNIQYVTLFMSSVLGCRLKLSPGLFLTLNCFKQVCPSWLFNWVYTLYLGNNTVFPLSTVFIFSANCQRFKMSLKDSVACFTEILKRKWQF